MEEKNIQTSLDKELDRCEFYLLKDSAVPGVLLCRHESTDNYPVSFTLIYCPNDQGMSEISAYKIFGAVIYHTQNISEVSKGRDNKFTPIIEVSTDIKSFLVENPEYVLNKCWESIYSDNTNYPPSYFSPYKEMIEEVAGILKECKNNHMPSNKKNKS